MTIPEIVANINNNFSSLLKIGISFLTEDMSKNPSFNPSAPYAEKNYYFERANSIGVILVKTGLNHFAEIYYQEMLKAINVYEQRNSKTFNKGMVYGNLGISKIAQGEYDRGIAYLMAGFKEDAPITGDHERQFLSSPLYLQFEIPVHQYIISKRQGYISGTVDAKYGQDFMNSLEVDNRLYLMAIISSLRINLEVFTNGNDNKYTRGRILSTLSDLCTFIEDAIKRKVNPTEQRITLNPLFENYVFSTESWKTIVLDNWARLTSSDCMGNLESNIQLIFALGNQDAQRFLLLGAIRNFSGHNFDTNGPFFFSHINDIEKNIFDAIFYLKDIGKL